MKQHRIRFLHSLILTGVISAGSVHASLVRTEQFVNYSTGTLGLDSAHGSLNGWNATSPLITLTNGSGSLSGTSLGFVASAGDRAFLRFTNAPAAGAGARNQFAPNLTFNPTLGNTNVYYSFLYKFQDATQIPTAGEFIAQVFHANSGTGTAQHWALQAKNVAGQIQLGISKAGAPNNATNWASTTVSANNVFLVVVRQQLITGIQNDIYDLWVNPPPQTFSTNELNVPTPDASVGALTTDGSESTSGTGPGRILFYAGPGAEFDEFRVGTTWADVTPYFGQCLSAGIAVSPASVTNSAELNNTFIVTEIGTSPTIQWQRSTNNGTTWFDIPGANVSIYTTPNLALSENGSKYRAIVNVACDNSYATSAVATVTLTTPTPTATGTVMFDKFDNIVDPNIGDASRNDTPFSGTNSLWYTFLATASGEADSGLAVFGQGGNMVGTPQSGASSLWLGYYTDTNQPPVHLAVGKALKITLPFTPSGYASHTNNSSVRIGLLDYFDGGVRILADGAAAGGSRGNGAGVRGYMFNLDFGPTFSVNSPLQWLARNILSDDNLLGSIADFDSFGSGPAGGGFNGAPAFQAGTSYVMELTVARTDVNTVDLTASITGGGTNWTHSVTDTNYAYHRFDAIALRPNSLETSADSITFPDFKVEVLNATIPVTPFNITGIQALSAGPSSVRITWNSISGVNYQIQSRNSLSSGSWATNATVQATGASTSYTNSPGGASALFYRVVATP